MGWDGLLAGGMRKLSHMMGMVQNFIANIGFQCGKPNKKITMTGDGLYHHLWWFWTWFIALGLPHRFHQETWGIQEESGGLIPTVGQLSAMKDRHSWGNHPEKVWDGYGSIPIDTFLVGWTSIYQLFWCSPGVQGFDPSPDEAWAILWVSLVCSGFTHREYRWSKTLKSARLLRNIAVRTIGKRRSRMETVMPSRWWCAWQSLATWLSLSDALFFDASPTMSLEKNNAWKFCKESVKNQWNRILSYYIPSGKLT